MEHIIDCSYLGAGFKIRAASLAIRVQESFLQLLNLITGPLIIIRDVLHPLVLSDWEHKQGRTLDLLSWIHTTLYRVPLRVFRKDRRRCSPSSLRATVAHIHQICFHTPLNFLHSIVILSRYIVILLRYSVIIVVRYSNISCTPHGAVFTCRVKY